MKDSPGCYKVHDFKIGDWIKMPLSKVLNLADHHFIYVGCADVIEYDRAQGVIRTTMEDGWHKKAKLVRTNGGDDAALKAKSRVGEKSYNLKDNNCEHFCAWCYNDKCHCGQSEKFQETVQWLNKNSKTMGDPEDRYY